MKDKRIEKTLKNIENSFLDLLETKKFQNITVTDICKKANINRCTFYAHYDNTFVLLETLQKKLVNEFLESFNEYNFDTDSKKMIDLLFKEIKENKKLFSLLFSFENQENIAKIIEENMKQKFECLVNSKELYQLQIGNMTVEFEYSENDKKINECMLNILKRKIGK